MGLAFEETIKNKLTTGETINFTLYAYTDDFYEENEEGAYTCAIEILDSNKNLINKYYRFFKTKDFNIKHYKNFIHKFCESPEYREYFNVKNDIIMPRLDKNSIDPKLIEIINIFNAKGMITKYSCQGTNAPWCDRPHQKDGHSVLAYILFQDMLPLEFLKILKKFGGDKIEINADKIESSKREFNIIFPEIVHNSLAEYLKLKK